MKVLIISHNCISSTSNMGKTLLSYFYGFQEGEVAQFFIHCEEPVDDSLCHNYFRFTDTDAVFSLFSGKSRGRVFQRQDIRTDRIRSRTDTGLLENIYQYGQRRTAWIYGLRDLLWRYSRWNTEKFRSWVKAFEPDVVFFASGDYGFSYEIALTVADLVKKPLVVCCVDEYYLHNRNAEHLLGRLVHKRFLKTVYKTMDRASAIFTICDSLQRIYQDLFDKPCYVLRTAARERFYSGICGTGSVAYLGNLELKREQQLIRIGKTLQKLQLTGGPCCLDVYSCEQDPKLLKQMTEENGICFHGAVSAEQVIQVMQNAMAVIHTESFDENIQQIVRHSVSTKIPESLMNGPCLIAYGPEGVASMDYLKETGAAWCITRPGDLEADLRQILTDPGLRSSIVTRAREVARCNHDGQAIPAQLRSWLEQVCREWEEHEGHSNQLCVSPGQHRRTGSGDPQLPERTGGCVKDPLWPGAQSSGPGCPEAVSGNLRKGK